MRLIDADACWDRVLNGFCDTTESAIMGTPTIDPVHAAGAVYCKECKYCEQHHDEPTNETSYKCTKYSLYYFSDKKPNDFCSQGILKLPLQEEISDWLTERAFFADNISETEFLMQQIYFDNSKYEGKQKDQEEIANNCKTVEDAYYYIQTHKLNVNKFYNIE